MQITNLRNIILAVSLFFTAMSCSETTEVVPESSKIEIENFSVNIEQGDTTLSFYAGNNWTAALNVTSWIKINELTKVGSKGDSKVTVEWQKYTGTTPRTATLILAVTGEETVKVTITQLPNAPYVIFDTESLELKAQQMTNETSAFIDTIAVQSNMKWTIKEKPEWADFSYISDKRPQEGVHTNIQMIIKGNPLKFTEEVSTGRFVAGSIESTETDATLAVSATTEIKLLDESNQENPTELVMMSSGATGFVYSSLLKVHSNTLWEVQGAPEWMNVSIVNNSEDFANGVLTKKNIFFTIDHTNLTTEGNEAKIVIANVNTKVAKTVTIKFLGVGENYFYFNWELPQDFTFSPSMEVENPVMNYAFDCYSSQPFTDMYEAPVIAYFINMQNGFTLREEIFWARMDVAWTNRALVTHNRLEVRVDARGGMGDRDPYALREAGFIVVDKSVTFDDLFIGNTEDLKEEYYSELRIISQQQLVREDLDIQIPENIVAEAAGFTGIYGIEGAVFPSIKIKATGEYLPLDHWLSVAYINFDGTPTLEGMPSEQIKLTVDPNDTGASRTEVFEFTIYNPVTDQEEILKTFTISQEAL